MTYSELTWFTTTTMHSRVNYESAGHHCVFTHVLDKRETLCTKVLCSSGKPVFASVYANSCSTGFEKQCRWSEKSTITGAKGVYQALPVLEWRVGSSPGLAGRASLLRVAGSVCVAATTLCVTEENNQQAQEARCKRGTLQARNAARC